MQVHSVGVNPCEAKFMIGDKLPTFLKKYAPKFVRGNIPGFDFAGIVLEIPEVCPDFNVGDHVFGTMPAYKGSFAEIVLAPIDQIALLSDDIDLTAASVLPLASLTCMQIMKDAFLSEKNLLVIGASGGVGLMAIRKKLIHLLYIESSFIRLFVLEIGRCLGAERVVGICSSANADLVRSYGSDSALNYSNMEQLKGFLKDEVAANGPFRLILDCVTSNDSRDKSFNYEAVGHPLKASSGGSYVRLGGPATDWFKESVRSSTGVNLFQANEAQQFKVKLQKR